MPRALLFILSITAALPIRERTSCDLVSVVHTNMTPEQANELLEVYISMAEGMLPQDMDGQEISDKVAERHGGVWGMYLMGEAFSYSVYCLQYVELAGDWLLPRVCHWYTASAELLRCHSQRHSTALLLPVHLSARRRVLDSDALQGGGRPGCHRLRKPRPDTVRKWHPTPTVICDLAAQPRFLPGPYTPHVFTLLQTSLSSTTPHRTTRHATAR